MLRALLGELRWIVWEIGDDQTAFGRVSCAVAGLAHLQVRRRQQSAFLEENLLQAVQGLCNVADGRLQLKTPRRSATRPHSPVAGIPL